MPAFGRHTLGRCEGLACDGVDGLVAALDQRAEGVDEVFDLGFLQTEEVEFAGDLVELRHGLFIGDAIGIHVYSLHRAKFSIGRQLKNQGTEG